MNIPSVPSGDDDGDDDQSIFQTPLRFTDKTAKSRKELQGFDDDEAYVTQQREDMEALADNFGNSAPQSCGRKRTRKPPATKAESESSAFRWLPASPPTSSVCNDNLTATAAEPVTKKTRLSYVVNNAEDARERALMNDILNGEELPTTTTPSIRSAYFNSSNESMPISCDEEEEEEEAIYRGSPTMPSGWLGPDRSGSRTASHGFQVNTDCCGDNPSLEYQEEVWCFGCQWVVRGHRPVDHAKIKDLTQCFMNLILQGSTSLENVGRIVSNLYRKTIRGPSIAAGDWLPDWPPAVVQKHIENMTEPRVVYALMLRKHLAMMKQVFSGVTRVDARTGQTVTDLASVKVWNQSMRELRDLYRIVPKESFGYNETFQAESWSGGVLVHPTRVAAPEETQRFSGAPVGSQSRRAGVRGPTLNAGGGDTGDLRGPANDELLVRD